MNLPHHEYRQTIIYNVARYFSLKFSYVTREFSLGSDTSSGQHILVGKRTTVLGPTITFPNTFLLVTKLYECIKQILKARFLYENFLKKSHFYPDYLLKYFSIYVQK